MARWGTMCFAFIQRLLHGGRPAHPIPRNHSFDKKYGVATSGYIPSSSLRTGCDSDRDNAGYYPSPPSMVQASIQLWQSTALAAACPSGLSPAAALRHWTFIDIGAGLGRAVMVAARSHFRQVLGLEISPRLARQARANLRRWRAHAQDACPTRIVRADASNFRWPQGPLLLYLFHPFEEPLLNQLLDSLEEADQAAPIHLAYMNPLLGHVIEGRARWQLAARHTEPLAPEDRASELFSGNLQAHRTAECRVYCLLPHNQRGTATAYAPAMQGGMPTTGRPAA